LSGQYSQDLSARAAGGVPAKPRPTTRVVFG
jgi:hypothetical protein